MDTKYSPISVDPRNDVWVVLIYKTFHRTIFVPSVEKTIRENHPSASDDLVWEAVDHHVTEDILEWVDKLPPFLSDDVSVLILERDGYTKSFVSKLFFNRILEKFYDRYPNGKLPQIYHS